MNALIDYSGSSSDDDSDAEIEVPQDYAGPRVEQVDEPAGPAYPNTDGAYPDAYPDADAAYPNTDGAYPDTDGAYPNTDDAYPDTDGAYPDTDAAYPDTDAAYPDTDAQFAPVRTFEVGAWRCAECQEEVKRIRYECPRCFAPRSERCLAYVSEDGVTRPLADLTLDPRVAATLPWAAWEDPATGARYYHNDATGESTWDEPADQYRPAERKPPCPDVPPGWVATWDVDAWAYYFFDAARGASTWRYPGPPPPRERFVAAATYLGARPGYVFTTRRGRTGYYLEDGGAPPGAAPPQGRAPPPAAAAPPPPAAADPPAEDAYAGLPPDVAARLASLRGEAPPPPQAPPPPPPPTQGRQKQKKRNPWDGLVGQARRDMKARCLGQRQAGGNRGQVDLMDVTAPGYATSYTFDDGAAPAAPAEHVGLPSPGEVLRMNAAAGGGGAPPPPRQQPRAPAGMVPRAARQAPRMVPRSARDQAAAAAAAALSGGGSKKDDVMAMFAGAGFKSSKAADSTTAKDMSERERRDGWEDFQSRVSNA